MKVTAVFLVGCMAASLCGCDSSRPDSRAAYAQQLNGVAGESQTYLRFYATNRVRCESGRQVFCTEARANLAHVERASQQLLAIAERMSQDAGLDQQDRIQAQVSISILRDRLQRIQSAKRGRLPEL